MAYISIHAPAEGATSLHIVQCDVINISIHAPAEGATLYDSFRSILYRFQSTLPRRERLRCTGEQEGEKEISIHAPAEGATCLFPGIAAVNINFNPRSRGGSDSVCEDCWLASMFDFNPRSRGGATEIQMPFFSGSPISIHAPAEGATRPAI